MKEKKKNLILNSINPDIKDFDEEHYMEILTLQNQITAKLAKIETVENLEREHIHKENTYGAYLKNSNNMLNFCDNMGKEFLKP